MDKQAPEARQGRDSRGGLDKAERLGLPDHVCPSRQMLDAQVGWELNDSPAYRVGEQR